MKLQRAMRMTILLLASACLDIQAKTNLELKNVDQKIFENTATRSKIIAEFPLTAQSRRRADNNPQIAILELPAPPRASNPGQNQPAGQSRSRKFSPMKPNAGILFFSTGVGAIVGAIVGGATGGASFNGLGLGAIAGAAAAGGTTTAGYVFEDFLFGGDLWPFYGAGIGAAVSSLITGLSLKSMLLGGVLGLFGVALVVADGA